MGCGGRVRGAAPSTAPRRRWRGNKQRCGSGGVGMGLYVSMSMGAYVRGRVRELGCSVHALGCGNGQKRRCPTTPHPPTRTYARTHSKETWRAVLAVLKHDQFSTANGVHVSLRTKSTCSVSRALPYWDDKLVSCGHFECGLDGHTNAHQTAPVEERHHEPGPEEPSDLPVPG